MNLYQKTNPKSCFSINKRFFFEVSSMKLTDSHSQHYIYLSYKEGQLLHLIFMGVNNKQDLISGLWGQHNMVVSDSSYYKIIHLLRKKLMQIGLPKETLRTQSRIGLLCVLPVESVDPPEDIPGHNITEHNINNDNGVEQTVFNLDSIINMDNKANNTNFSAIINNNSTTPGYNTASNTTKALSCYKKKISGFKQPYGYGMVLGVFIVMTNIAFLISFFTSYAC